MSEDVILNRLRLGRVTTYISRTSPDGEVKGGYGWLSSELTPGESGEFWFHISTIKQKYPDIRERLDSRTTELSNFYFWYVVDQSQGKYFVSDLWASWREIGVSPERLIEELITRLQSCREADRQEFARKLYASVGDLLRDYPDRAAQVLRCLSADSLLSVLEARTEISPAEMDVFLQVLQQTPIEELVRLYSRAQNLKVAVRAVIEQSVYHARDEDIPTALSFLLKIDSDHCISNSRIRALARQYLPHNEFVELIDRAVKQLPADHVLIGDLVTEIEDFLSEFTEEQRDGLWNSMPSLRSLIEYEGRLWSVAPSAEKKRAIRTRYSDFFGIVDEILRYTETGSGAPVEVYANTIEQEYDDSEIDLICTWAEPYFTQIRKRYLSAKLEYEEVLGRWQGNRERLESEYQRLSEDIRIVREYEIAKQRYEELIPSYEDFMRRCKGDLHRFEKIREIASADYRTITEYEAAKSRYEETKRAYEKVREHRFSYDSGIGDYSRLDSSAERQILQQYEQAKTCYQQLEHAYTQVLNRWKGDLDRLVRLKDRINQDFQLLQRYRNAEKRYRETEEKYLRVLSDWDNNLQILFQQYETVHNDWQKVGEYDTSYNTYQGYRKKYQVHERECSARCAEKIALGFIRSLLPTARIEDLSILQVVESNDERWKLADIEISSANLSRMVDVKSARMSENLMYYSELLVPRFKQNRSQSDKKDVIICGVAMPRSGCKQDAQSVVKLPAVLGFTTLQILSNLKNYFEANRISFAMSRNDEQGNWLPVWVFDYNTKYYRRLHNLALRIRNLSDEQIPPMHYLSKYFPEVPAIAILVASRRRLPEPHESSLSDWQKRLVRKLWRVYDFHRSISLPFLVAALITHFIEQIAQGDDNFAPSQYLHFLSINGRPLGVRDPLQVVTNFVKHVLEPLWQSRSQLSEYKIFSIYGMRLLRAKRNPSDSWETLVAWCQGCGFYPLVYGTHELCEECKRLICNRAVPFEVIDTAQGNHKEVMYACSVCQQGKHSSKPCSQCKLRVFMAKVEAVEKMTDQWRSVSRAITNTLTEFENLKKDSQMVAQLRQVDEYGARLIRASVDMIARVLRQHNCSRDLASSLNGILTRIEFNIRSFLSQYADDLANTLEKVEAIQQELQKK